MHLSRESIRTVATHEALIESEKWVAQGGAPMTDEELKAYADGRETTICAKSQHDMFLHVHDGLQDLVRCPSHMPKVFELNPGLNTQLTDLLEQDQANLLEDQQNNQSNNEE